MKVKVAALGRLWDVPNKPDGICGRKATQKRVSFACGDSMFFSLDLSVLGEGNMAAMAAFSISGMLELQSWLLAYRDSSVFDDTILSS